jgi:hypothetical protein
LGCGCLNSLSQFVEKGAKRLGVLLASGLIVGESIIVVFSGEAAPISLVGPFETPAIIIGGLAFAATAFILYRWTLRMTTARTA